MSDEVPYEPAQIKDSTSMNLTSKAGPEPMVIARSRRSSLLPDGRSVTCLDSSLTLQDALPADAIYVPNFLDSNLVTQSDQI